MSAPAAALMTADAFAEFCALPANAEKRGEGETLTGDGPLADLAIPVSQLFDYLGANEDIQNGT